MYTTNLFRSMRIMDSFKTKTLTFIGEQLSSDDPAATYRYEDVALGYRFAHERGFSLAAGICVFVWDLVGAGGAVDGRAAQ